MQELNMSLDADIRKDMIPKLSMLIILKLLRKECIKVNYENPLPCPSYFMNQLFKEYAENNVIDKENMKQLMENLNIGRQLKNGSGTKVNISKTEDKLARKKREVLDRSSVRRSLYNFLRGKQQQDGSHGYEIQSDIYEKVCER